MNPQISLQRQRKWRLVYWEEMKYIYDTSIPLPLFNFSKSCVLNFRAKQNQMLSEPPPSFVRWVTWVYWHHFMSGPNKRKLNHDCTSAHYPIFGHPIVHIMCRPSLPVVRRSSPQPTRLLISPILCFGFIHCVDEGIFVFYTTYMTYV